MENSLAVSYKPRAQMVNDLPEMWETRVQFLGQEDSLEKEMATHSRILAWRILWTEEPGGLQSTGSQRVGHDWATNTFIFHYKKKWGNSLVVWCLRHCLLFKGVKVRSLVRKLRSHMLQGMAKNKINTVWKKCLKKKMKLPTTLTLGHLS